MDENRTNRDLIMKIACMISYVLRRWKVVLLIVLIGAMAKSLGTEKEIWLKTIEKTVPPKFVEMNKRAFELGYAAEK